MSKNDDSIFGMIKLGLILALYAAVSCAVLAVVNNITAPQIAKNQNRKIYASVEEFFQGSDYSFETVTDYEPKSAGTIAIESIIIAKKNGKIDGGAVRVSGPTYDKGTIILGMDNNGTVKGLKILELSDSPGFGLKANDPTFTLPNGKTFYGQFAGKDAKAGFKAGTTFDAIAGATITSNGIADLMNTGSSVLLDYLSNHK